MDSLSSYYMGRIHALQLDYTDAYTKLMQSSRKVPQNTAMGFQRAAQKLVIIVQVCLVLVVTTAAAAAADCWHFEPSTM